MSYALPPPMAVCLFFLLLVMMKSFHLAILLIEVNDEFFIFTFIILMKRLAGLCIDRLEFWRLQNLVLQVLFASELYIIRHESNFYKCRVTYNKGGSFAGKLKKLFHQKMMKSGQ